MFKSMKYLGIYSNNFLQQCCTSQNRYCQEAVDSVTVVDSCPTSKAEWDVASRMKDCSRIALGQKCTTAEKFQYHCVINGYRNVTLQVCAPTRIIFGIYTVFYLHYTFVNVSKLWLLFCSYCVDARYDAKTYVRKTVFFGKSLCKQNNVLAQNKTPLGHFTFP